MQNGGVVVLNADMTYLQTVSWQDAIVMMLKGIAEPVTQSARVIRSVSIEMVVPKVIKLVRYVKKQYNKLVTFKKRRVFQRDRYVCQYCGAVLDYREATLDHVVPRAKKGRSSYENCVTACKSCNTRKGGRTPAEAKMHLARQPKTPSVAEIHQAAAEECKVYELIGGMG